MSGARPAGGRRLRGAWRLTRVALHLAHGMAVMALRFPHLGAIERQARIGWFSARLLQCLDITLSVQGRPAEGPSLLVANHVSWLDIAALHAAVPQARFVSKADIRHWPLVGWLVAGAGTLFVERASKRDALRVVHQTAEALRAGDTVAVFPEGTTGPGPELLPFHANLLQAAVATGTPVQPAVLRYHDPDHAFSPAAEFVGATTLWQSVWALATAERLSVSVQLLEPIAAGPTAADRRALAALLRTHIDAALSKARPTWPAAAGHDAAEVVIVGAGPVGMGLAIELGQRGVRCVVVERHAEPQPIPKGQNLTQRTMEHFHFWGAEQRLRAARTIPPEYGIGGLTAYGTLLGPHVHDWLQRDLVRPYYHTANERLPQYATEAVLRERAAELPSVQTLYGWDAAALVQDDHGVSLSVTDRASGAARVVRAAYAVGCDGSRSRVREQAGLTQTRTDHDRTMVLLVFRSTQLHDLLARYPGKSFYNVLHPALEGYWKFFGRVDLGHSWFFHAPVPAGTTAHNFDFRAFLHEAVGAPFEVEFEHIGFWDLRFALADAYRAGRIFIAGDAAHSHPPYGGYGINSGLEDARNLGWKLAAVLQGWGGAHLLDSYEAERRPVFRSTIDDFIAKSIETDRAFLAAFDPARDTAAFDAAWQARAQGAVGEVQAFEPNYEGSPAVWPRGGTARVSSAKGSHRFEACAGHHLAPAVLGSGAPVFEALGPGFTLLALGAPAADVETFRAAAAALGLPLSVVVDAAPAQTARYAATLVLVRPDQFVAWSTQAAGVGIDEARAVLELARGAGAPPTPPGPELVQAAPRA